MAPSERIVSHAATAPGTETAWAPKTGMPPCSACRAAAFAASGAAPEPLTARTVPSGVATSAKMSPPTAHMCG